MSAALALLGACGGSDDEARAPEVAVTAKGSVQAVDRLGMPTFAGNGASDVLGFDVASGGGVQVLATSFDTAHQCSSVWSMLTF